MPEITLETRLRLKPDDSSSTFDIAFQTVEWDPENAAVIICDMWDTHHCISTAKRVAEMAPRMNEVVAGMRKGGALVIHAPSGCMGSYDKTPQRQRAQEAPFVKAPVEILWRGWKEGREIRQLKESRVPIGITDPGPCSCHTSEPCCEEGHYPWVRQIDTIEIAEEDAISDDGLEVHNLLQQRGIEDILMMGVATNVCVLGRPFGIRQLVYLGKKPLLCRDLTDSHHRDDGGHFRGTDLTIEHIERYWCPTVTSDQIVGGEAFRFAEDMWVHLYDPHAPYEAPDDYARMMSHGYSRSRDSLLAFWTDVEKIPVDPDTEDYRLEQIADRVNAYDAEIAFADREIERLYDYVSDAGRNHRTLWVITSDHGEGLGNHHWLFHGRYIYNEALLVPLIFHFTDGAYAGGRLSDPVGLVDIMPTLAELQGLSLGKQSRRAQGISLLPLIRGEVAGIPKRFLFSQRRALQQTGASSDWEKGAIVALQDATSKYIYHSMSDDEYFDLAADPHELKNLVDVESSSRDQMKTTTVRFYESMHLEAMGATSSDIDEAHMEELRSLGYLP